MRPTFYVTPRALQWLIFSPGRRAHELETSRTRAIARAKVLARAVGGGEAVVARRDGTTEFVVPLPRPFPAASGGRGREEA